MEFVGVFHHIFQNVNNLFVRSTSCPKGTDYGTVDAVERPELFGGFGQIVGKVVRQIRRHENGNGKEGKQLLSHAQFPTGCLSPCSRNPTGASPSS